MWTYEKYWNDFQKNNTDSIPHKYPCTGLLNERTSGPKMGFNVEVGIVQRERPCIFFNIRYM